MKIFDDEEAIYIIHNCNDIVLSIPYYVESECGIEDPYAHNKEGAMSLAEAIIEKFYKRGERMRSCVSDEGWEELQKLIRPPSFSSDEELWKYEAKKVERIVREEYLKNSKKND